MQVNAIMQICGLRRPETFLDTELATKMAQGSSRKFVFCFFLIMVFIATAILLRTKTSTWNIFETKADSEWSTVHSTGAPWSTARSTGVPWSTVLWPRAHLKNCSHIEFMNFSMAGPTSLLYPRTGLVSSPGHGNTWTRHIVEKATGFWTGSVFFDEDLYKGGFIGEREDCLLNNTVAVKAHVLGRDCKKCQFDRVILVVRDLYHGLLAEFNREYGHGHTGQANKNLFLGSKWTSYTRKWSSYSANIVLDWIKRYKDKGKDLKNDENPFVARNDFWRNIILVSYERLKRDPVLEAERIVKFLGLPIFRKHCVEADPQGHFKRSGNKEYTVACIYRSSEMRDLVEKAEEHLLQEARKIGVGDILAEFAGVGNADLDKC